MITQTVKFEYITGIKRLNLSNAAYSAGGIITAGISILEQNVRCRKISAMKQTQAGIRITPLPLRPF